MHVPAAWVFLTTMLAAVGASADAGQGDSAEMGSGMPVTGNTLWNETISI